ncbi:hypothetical protein VT85_10245 [Planctomyces sp. SH-PL62]|nr:hypothetical protein VT85_10245 [Planctomyces sp. SH-PL62]
MRYAASTSDAPPRLPALPQEGPPKRARPAFVLKADPDADERQADPADQGRRGEPLPGAAVQEHVQGEREHGPHQEEPAC